MKFHVFLPNNQRNGGGICILLIQKSNVKFVIKYISVCTFFPVKIFCTLPHLVEIGVSSIVLEACAAVDDNIFQLKSLLIDISYIIIKQGRDHNRQYINWDVYSEVTETNLKILNKFS